MRFIVNMRPVTGTTDEARQIGMRIFLKNLHHLLKGCRLMNFNPRFTYAK